MKSLNWKARALVFTLTSVSCVGLAGVAAAQNLADSDLPSATVHYSDLNLARPNDVHILYRRIAIAARQVCGNVAIVDLSRYVHFQACVQHAMDGAVQQVHSSTLSALHEDQSRRSRG